MLSTIDNKSTIAGHVGLFQEYIWINSKLMTGHTIQLHLPSACSYVKPRPNDSSIEYPGQHNPGLRRNWFTRARWYREHSFEAKPLPCVSGGVVWKAVGSRKDSQLHIGGNADTDLTLAKFTCLFSNAITEIKHSTYEVQRRTKKGETFYMSEDTCCWDSPTW